MKITPTQHYLLVRLEEVPPASPVLRPDTVRRESYGVVVLAGPDCKIHKKGDKVCFLPENIIGFDPGGDERFIIPESAVFATIDPDNIQ